jgi:transketolase
MNGTDRVPEPIDANLIHNLSKIATTIRTLSVDAVQKADSGHPGLPLGCAELGAYIYGHLLRHNPLNPSWINRDRFVLSAGHGSMLLYSCLYLSGFNLSLEDIKQFRQLHSKTPGHPEYHLTPGVETTSGPLGQGFGNGVGMALGLKMLAKRFNTDEFPLFTSKVFVLAGDGCIMEGVSAETSSLAGHLGLDNLVVFYDDNAVTLDGPLSDSCSEDTKMRYRAYGWDVFEISGHDFEQIDRAVRQAIYDQKKPVLIIAKTSIGKGSPTFAGTHKVHGAPLGRSEILKMKELLGLSSEDFNVSPSVLEFFKQKRVYDAERESEWNKLFENWSRTFPERRKEFDLMRSAPSFDDLEQILSPLSIKAPTSGRKASWECLNTLVDKLPQLIAGSADLSSSDMTSIKNYPVVTKDHMNGRVIKFGVREFGMATAAIGLSETGMFIPVIGTFLTFSDYMRNAIRMSSLMHTQVIFQFTHDSIFLGEDGPTHQPIEQLPSLRIIPHLQVIRPSGTHEVKMAWIAALTHEGPTALILSRQNIRDLPQTVVPFSQGLGRGGYVIRTENRPANFTLIATGSELPLALDVAESLEKIGKSVRVVSMPCTQLFDKQSKNYKESVLSNCPGRKVSIEAAAEGSWHKYIGEDGIAIAIEDFGASAPASALAQQYGFTVESILDRLLS